MKVFRLWGKQEKCGIAQKRNGIYYWVVLDYENSTAFLNSPVIGSLAALKAAAKPKSKYTTNPELLDVLGVGTLFCRPFLVTHRPNTLDKHEEGQPQLYA